jgi:hypothetical protein
VSSGPGLLTETLLELLVEQRPHVLVVGIGQNLLDYHEARDLQKVGRELAGGGACGSGHES